MLDAISLPAPGLRGCLAGWEQELLLLLAGLGELPVLPALPHSWA